MIKYLTAALAAALAAITMASAAEAQDANRDVVQQWSAVKAEPAPEVKAVTLVSAKTAIIITDFSQKNCPQRPRCAAAIPHAVKVIAQGRAKGMLLIFSRNDNMKREEYVPDLAPKPGEIDLQAAREDRFFGTDLDKMLKDKGIDTLLLMGVQASGSVMGTSFGAAYHGYKVIVPVDTMPANTAYQEQFAIWEIANATSLRNVSTLTRSDLIGF